MSYTGKQSNLAKQLLKYAISCPPSRAGMRLQPEIELCRILGIGRKPISTSLNELSEEGIVGRRRGSGTFIRKVTPFNKLQKELWDKYATANSSEVFAEGLTMVAEAEKLGCGKQKLNIGLWGDWDEPTQSQQARINGMKKAIEAEGHFLTIHSVMQDSQNPVSAEFLKKRIEESGCCGFLVVASRAFIFLDAINEKKLPVVFCGVNNNYNLQPGVTQAYKSIYNQVFDIFKRNGFTKIGTIGITDNNFLTPENQNKTYSRTIEDTQLSYKKSLLIDCNNYENIEQRIQKYLTAPDRPEAVYISDDTLIEGFRGALKLSGLQAGKDIGVICLENKQTCSPAPEDWSKMVFDQEMIGRTAAEELLDIISDSSFRPGNIKFIPNWLPGKTHIKID